MPGISVADPCAPARSVERTGPCPE
jgi:hypothetical protein